MLATPAPIHSNNLDGLRNAYVLHRVAVVSARDGLSASEAVAAVVVQVDVAVRATLPARVVGGVTVDTRCLGPTAWQSAGEGVVPSLEAAVLGNQGTVGGETCANDRESELANEPRAGRRLCV